MSISVNGINLPEAVLNLEYEMARTQRILEWVINNNANVRGPSAEQIKVIDSDTIRDLQKKYPAAGIEVTKKAAPTPPPPPTPAKW